MKQQENTKAIEVSNLQNGAVLPFCFPLHYVKVQLTVKFPYFKLIKQRNIINQ